jgi:hypothetical protein
MRRTLLWVKALWIFLRSVLPGPKSWLNTAMGLGIIMAVAFASQSACYPWAYPISFGPTLTGAWLGELTPAIGGKHVIFIKLSAALGERDDNLEGTVSLCRSPDDVHEFGVSGSTRNWSGTEFRIISFITERRDGRGVQLANSDGEWNGRDEIHLNAHLRLFRIENGGSISTTDRSPEQIALEDTPVAFDMRRGNAQAFMAACGALARTR